MHAGDCWDPTVAELAVQAPDVRVLAVDLPGRRGAPGDLATLTIDQCVDGVIAQIEEAGLDEVVVVGHSMAGITVPGVVARLGEARVKRLVLVSCCIPPEGKTVLDTLYGPLRWLGSRTMRAGGISQPMPKPMARFFFCNGMTPEQSDFVTSHLHPDSVGVTRQPVSRVGLPRTVPRTWVLPLRDRSLRPDKQRMFIDNLGGVDEVVELDTCHDAMASDPRGLAAILAERAR
jgi:pimeloyl-ACP methyl ester carboxylesterase